MLATSIFTWTFGSFSLVSRPDHFRHSHQEPDMEDQGAQFSSILERMGSRLRTPLSMWRTRLFRRKTYSIIRTPFCSFTWGISPCNTLPIEFTGLHMAIVYTMDGTRAKDFLPMATKMAIAQPISRPMESSPSFTMARTWAQPRAQHRRPHQQIQTHHTRNSNAKKICPLSSRSSPSPDFHCLPMPLPSFTEEDLLWSRCLWTVHRWTTDTPWSIVRSSQTRTTSSGTILDQPRRHPALCLHPTQAV